MFYFNLALSKLNNGALKNIFYFIVKNLLFAFNYIYFRKVQIYGKENIPKNGGILYSPNHQGAFLDPILIGTLTPKKITSLTRSDVFGGPLQWFMDALNMLPVYRIRNGYSNLKKNDAIFDKCFNIIGNSGNLLMFSEGGHHNEYFLQNLSKGSSRLVYKAQQKHPDQTIWLMPTGINYGHHQQPHCTLHLVFGKPILVGDYMNPKNTDAENINNLRLQLQSNMKDCLWLPNNDAFYLEKKPLINARSTKMDFFSLKKALEQEQPNLPLPYKKGKTIQFIAAFLAIPNFIPLWISRKIIGLFKDIVFYSSMKYAVGALIFPFYWMLLGGCLFLFFNLNVALIVVAIAVITIFLRSRVLLK